MLKKQGLTILHSLPTVIVPSCFSVQFVILGWKLEILCPVDTVIEADATNHPWKWADLSFWLAGIGASLIAQLVKALNLSQNQGLFQWVIFFTSDGQSTGASASASVLPMNIQGCFPLGLTGLISLQSKGLSRVFSSTTIQEHQFYGAQSSLWSNSHIHR